MAHDLFKQFSAQNDRYAQISAQIRQMQKNFPGNPQQEVQRLLQSGQMTQEQFNQLAQAANQIFPHLK